MADKQISSRNEVSRDFVNYRFLGVTVEINHYVSEEDSVKEIANAVILIHEIQMMKTDLSPQFRSDASQGLGVIVAA
jgi:hypothetical protein